MIRVFIGAHGPQDERPRRVLEHSIRENTEYDVEFNTCGDGSGRTAFSSGRWNVPALCDYEGFAIYMDSDMLVFADIKQLWDYRSEGEWATTPVGNSVSVIDCSAFKDLKPNLHRKHYRRLMAGRYSDYIPIRWNVLDRIPKPGPEHPVDWYPPDDTNILHYTLVGLQPWGVNWPRPHMGERRIDRLWLDYEASIAD